MSDKTPESAGYDELTENEPAEEPAADGAAADVDSTPDQEAAPSPSVRRRTAKAPVRKKDLARSVDPAEDDDVISELEEGFDPGSGDVPGGVGTVVTRRTAKAPVKKTSATRKRPAGQREERDPYGPTNPANFVRQSAEELRRVVWPTWPELVSYFLAVLVFVLFFIAFIGLADLFFGWGLLNLFGTKS